MKNQTKTISGRKLRQIIADMVEDITAGANSKKFAKLLQISKLCNRFAMSNKSLCSMPMSLGYWLGNIRAFFMSRHKQLRLSYPFSYRLFGDTMICLTTGYDSRFSV